MTMVGGNAVQGLQWFTQGIYDMHMQLVDLYHGVKSRDSLAPETVKDYLDDFAERTPQGETLEMTFLQLLLDFEAKEKRGKYYAWVITGSRQARTITILRKD